MTAASHETVASTWPHRLAVALAALTFPLVWVGSMVTTSDAGMAVPDWPNTYGYNLFLYPWTTWLYGPWDIFIEHGHRLLAAVGGMLALALAIVAWRVERRPAVRMLAIAALALVVLQGVLGGLRVLWSSVDLARLHACLAPAYFALTVVLASVSAAPRARAGYDAAARDVARLRSLSLVTALVAYAQLILGAQLRHVPAAATPAYFQTMIVLHLIGAAILSLHVVAVLVNVVRHFRAATIVTRPAAVLGLAVLVQLTLGAGTWLARFGAPSWLSSYSWAANFTVVAEGRAQTWLINGHVVTGSLIMASAVLLAVRAWTLAAAPLGTLRSPATLRGATA